MIFRQPLPGLLVGDVACAVGIAGPSPRLTEERVRRDVRLIHEAATVIGQALGLSTPPVTVSDASIGPAGKTRRREGSAR